MNNVEELKKELSRVRRREIETYTTFAELIGNIEDFLGNGKLCEIVDKLIEDDAAKIKRAFNESLKEFNNDA